LYMGERTLGFAACIELHKALDNTGAEYGAELVPPRTD